MKKLIIALIVSALLYCGYWFIASQQIANVAADKIAAYEESGVTISHNEIDIGGFPLKFASDLGPLSVSRVDPQAGTQQVILKSVSLAGKAYSPTNWSLRHSGEGSWSLAKGVTILSQTDRADISVVARPSGGLKSAKVLAQGVTLRGAKGQTFPVQTVESGTYSFTRQGANAVYDVTAKQVALDPSLIGQIGRALGPDLHAVSGQMIVEGFEGPSPRFKSDAMSLTWGDLNMSGALDLLTGPNGHSGQIVLKIKDQNQLIDKLTNSGILSSFEAMAANMIINGMPEDEQGNRALELTVNESAVSLGPLPLGRLPF